MLNRILKLKQRIYRQVDWWRRDVKVARGSYCDVKTKIEDHTRINRKSFLTEASVEKYCAIAGPLTIRSSNHDQNLLALQSHAMKNIICSSAKIMALCVMGYKLEIIVGWVIV